MKIIVAGYPKTGTKSITAALTELGYTVYGSAEHLVYHCDDWLRIFNGKGSISDFKRMYSDVDAVVDAPAFLFWYEIHQAFPEAKIILSMRDEDSWFANLQNEMQQLNAFYSTLFSMYAFKFIPVLRKRVKYEKTFMQEITGMPIDVGRLAIRFPINDMVARQKFRERNVFVAQVAPKPKLLVYHVNEGWDPLCEFLNLQIPLIPFPHSVLGNQSFFHGADEKYGQQVRRQFYISLVILAIMFLVIVFNMADNSLTNKIFTCIGGFLAVFLSL